VKRNVIKINKKSSTVFEKNEKDRNFFYKLKKLTKSKRKKLFS